MPRSLAVPSAGYTEEQVREALTKGVGVFRTRVDVYNLDGSHVETIDEITRGKVTFDGERAIPLGLDLTFAPLEALRNRPLQFLLNPVCEIGPMPNGDLVGFSQGVFAYTQPRRNVYPRGQERWHITTGDKTFFLDADGPGLDRLQVKADSGVDDAIRRVLERAGDTDFSGIVATDETFPNTLQYDLLHGARWKRVKKRTGEVEWKNIEGSQETYRLILDDWQEDIGYDRPHYSLDGVYRARPARSLNAGGADHEYVAGRPEEGDDTFLLPDDGVELDPDFAHVANVVHGVAQNKKDADFPATADLNDLLPDHPLAERKVRRYVKATITPSAAGAHKTIAAACQRELFDRISYFETTELETSYNPAHDLFDVVSLRIPDDPDLDTAGLYYEKGWTLDLITGRMTHDLRRLYRLAS